MTPPGKWHLLLCILYVTGCAQSSAPDAAEQARMSRAMAKMEADQARSDVAAMAANAKTNADADAVRRKAADGNSAD